MLALYKNDTYELSMYLARAAIEAEPGYPIDKFDVELMSGSKGVDAEGDDGDEKTGSSKAKAKMRNKQRVLKLIKEKQLRAASKDGKDGDISGKVASLPRPEIPPGNYAIKVSQYIDLANHIATHKVEVPDHVMQRLYRCIKLRMRTLQNFLGNPDWSTFTHEHFINVLREVGSILHEARAGTKAKAKAKAADEDEDTASGEVPNRFVSLDVLDKCEDDIVEDIGEDEAAGPASSAAPSAAAAAAQAQFDLKQSIDEAVMSAMSFFVELFKMRKYLVLVWHHFKTGKTDLMTAALTTQIGLELLRQPHDELMDKVLPIFDGLRDEFPACDNAVEIMLMHLLNARLESEIPGHVPHTSLPSYKDVKDDDYIVQWAFDSLCIPMYQLLKVIVRDSKKLPYPASTYEYDDSVGFNTEPFLRWRQLESLIIKTYSEYSIMAHDNRASITAMQPKDGRYDEMEKSLLECIKLRKPTLRAAFAAQVFTDINFVLGPLAGAGLTLLREGCAQMVGVLQDCVEREPTDGRPKLELLAREVKFTLFAHLHEMDSVTFLGNFRRPPKSPSSPILLRMLMPRSPMLCGADLLRLQLGYQAFGLKCSERWKAIPAVMHLYHAFRNLGTLDPESYPTWPDMDIIRRNHDVTHIFSGKIPETVGDAMISYMKTRNVPANYLQAVRRGDLDLPPVKIKQRKVAGDTKTYLEEQGKITKLLKDRFVAVLGVKHYTPLDVSNFKTVLNDMAVSDEEEARKRDGLPRSGKQRGSARELEPLELLDLLQSTLDREGFQWRFDYLSMNLRCLEVLKMIQEALHDEMQVLYGPDYLPGSLFGLPMQIFKEAMRAEHFASNHNLPLGPARLGCRFLPKAAEVLAKYLRESGESDVEVLKINSQRQGRPWPSARKIDPVKTEDFIALAIERMPPEMAAKIPLPKMKA
ncbi:hypothetical protein CF326_g3763 [Tilletia indica]|nr:hypothetical protein CF326_g3763 [Tilletia indica]